MMQIVLILLCYIATQWPFFSGNTTELREAQHMLREAQAVMSGIFQNSSKLFL
jgi:hypothetical protein